MESSNSRTMKLCKFFHIYTCIYICSWLSAFVDVSVCVFLNGIQGMEHLLYTTAFKISILACVHLSICSIHKDRSILMNAFSSREQRRKGRKEGGKEKGREGMSEGRKGERKEGRN